MCITNIGQKNLSTNKGLQSNVHESTGQWRHGGGGGDLGLEDGKGGRMNRGEDEIELEERQKAREGSTWARFLLCHKVAVRTDFLLSTMH